VLLRERRAGLWLLAEYNSKSDYGAITSPRRNDNRIIAATPANASKTAGMVG
jgi:hypothetical protein